MESGGVLEGIWWCPSGLLEASGAAEFRWSKRHIYNCNHATRGVDHVDLLHLGQCYGFLQGSILVTLLWQIFAKRGQFQGLTQHFCGQNSLKIVFRETPRPQFSTCVPSHGKSGVCTHPVAPSLDTWISN